MLGGTRLGRLGDRVGQLLVRPMVIALAVLLLGSLLTPRSALAGDRIGELTTMLSSSSDKTRLSAVLSLARLRDKRALKPLVTALQDPNPQVRAVAATALGKLGHKAALPALKNAAIDDVDATVRRTARKAALSVAKANKIESDLPSAPAAEHAPVQARTKTNTGFGRSPHAVENHPDLYVTVKGCNDDSPGKTDQGTRKTHADVLMAALKTQLKSASQVTTAAADAQRWGLDMRTLDVSVVKLEVIHNGSYVEIAAELRLAISDDKGRMLSFLSGGAKVQVPRSKYNARFLPSMRKEALEGALSGLFDKLLVHLRQIATT